MPRTTPENSLKNDAFLRDVPEVDGFKVLEPCVLYAKIGQGGMGAVYRGKHLNLDLEVGVKCLLPSLAQGDGQVVLRFEREARLAARVSHPNLVRVFDVDQRHGVHYLVMEYVKGETARERVERKGPLPLGEAITIVAESAQGLGAAHDENIVHRDIKPDNILISTDGRVKLADLGLGRMRQEDSGRTAVAGAETAGSGLTMPHMTMGTPRYMPPEQWESLSRVGPAGDVWALGATLYFLLVGDDAYRGETQHQIMCQVCTQPFPDILSLIPDLPADFLAVLKRATDRDPKKRYPHARGLAKDLERVFRENKLKASLSDPESGTRKAEATLVSPPPPELLAKVRLTLSSKKISSRDGAGASARDGAGASARDGAGASARDGTVASARDGATASVAEERHDGRRSRRSTDRPHSRRASDKPRSRRGLVLAIAALLLVGVGGLAAWKFGLFDGTNSTREDGTLATPEGGPDASARTPEKAVSGKGAPGTGVPEKNVSPGEGAQGETRTPPPADPRAEIESLLAEAARQVRSADGLDAAVVTYSRVLTLEAGNTAARDGLSLARTRIAERALAAGDLVTAQREILAARTLATSTLADRVALDVARAIRARVTDGFEILEPTGGAVVADARILVRGTVKSDLVRAVRVGKTAAVIAGGRFDAEVELPTTEGAHELLVELDVEGGENVRRRLPIVVDRTAPVFEALDLAEGAWITPERPLTGRVLDVSLASLSINTLPVEFDAEGRFKTLVRFDPETADPAGEKVVLVALDRGGLETRREIPVRVDRREPRLEVLSPRRVTTAGEPDGPIWTREPRIEVRVRVEEDGELEVVRIGGISAEREAGDEPIWRADVPLASDQLFSLPIIAVDRAGHEGRRQLDVRRDTIKPKLELSSPTRERLRSEIAPGVVRLSGSLEDAGECRIEVNGIKVTVTGGDWEIEVPVESTTKELRVVAVDEAENRAELVENLRVREVPKSAPKPETDEKPEVVRVPKTPVAEAAPPVFPGLTHLARNSQGYHEYKEDRSGLVLVLLPGGPFEMGKGDQEDGDGSERPRHRVTLDSFLIAKHEVTQEEFQRVLSVNYSNFRHQPGLPAEQMTWHEARDFCEKLGLALPTEAEWEYACRAGTKTPFATGETIDTNHANYNGQFPYGGGSPGVYLGRTTAVNAFPPNAFGLVGMHGNVMEWCEDMFDPRFYSRPEASEKNPLATQSTQTTRSVRGGSWFHHASGCRSAARQGLQPAGRYYLVGFRPVYRPK